MPGIKFILNGIAGVLKKVTDEQLKIKGAIAAAVYQEALDLDNRSVKECPVDYGTLRRSHYAAPPPNLDRPVAQVGYGTDYAVYVHEDTSKKHKDPTKSLFLKDPFDVTKTGYAERLAARAKENLANGVTLASVGSHGTPVEPTYEGRGHKGGDKGRKATGKGPKVKVA